MTYKLTLQLGGREIYISYYLKKQEVTSYTVTYNKVQVKPFS